jgi:hypothetical protein
MQLLSEGEVLKRLDLSDYRRFAVEFTLIVAGVLLALWLDDLRQNRADRAAERYILQGILADLEEDRGDIESSIEAASERTVGANKLLTEIGHAAAEKTLNANEALENARQLFPLDSLSLSTALQMLLAPQQMQVINIAAATFTEASAIGGLDLLDDVELRGDLAQYYYSATQVTVDERVDDHWRHLRNVLASRGLASEGASSDEEITEIIRADSALVAEIVNAREFALQQIGINSGVLEEVMELVLSIEAVLE